VRDAWFHLPLRFEDRTRITPIRELVPGARAQVEGVIDAVERGFRFRPQLKVVLSDESGGSLTLRFFKFTAPRRPARARRTPALLRRAAARPAGFDMSHPSYRRVVPGEVLPETFSAVYPTVEGLAQHRLRKVVAAALEHLPDGPASELVPEPVRQRLGLSPLVDAIRALHAPASAADAEAIGERRHPAQARIAFEELLAHRLGCGCGGSRSASAARPTSRSRGPGARSAGAAAVRAHRGAAPRTQ
jgi:ATP-dependent DNA helicase RecG